MDWHVYDLDTQRLKTVLHQRFGGDWVILQGRHPVLLSFLEGHQVKGDDIFETMSYPDFQELIAACDALLTDYSTSIFDAALKGIPCFTYAIDYKEYEADRGLYYKMDDLPFPFADSMDGLVDNIL